MSNKVLISTLLPLCFYGFFKEVRPSEPYLTEYLIGNDFKNLTEDQVYQQVYPVWSYSYFLLLIPVFLLTDFFRYKPVIVFEGMAYVVTWCLLLWAEGVAAMQIMQFFYGIATSTEVAYYTYIYAKVPKELYQRVASLSRFAILFGSFVSGLISQILVSTGALDYRGLNYISLADVSVAMVISLFLPSVNSSIYFHRNKDNEEKIDENSPKESVDIPGDQSSLEIFKTILNDAKKGYKQSYVVKWSVWVAISTCLNFQIGNYIQPLWEEIRPSEINGGQNNINNTNGTEEPEEIYNGAIEAATTLLGALVVFAIGIVKINWRKWGDLAILCVSLPGGAILIWMGLTEHIWIAYVGYMMFRMTYQVLMTVASFEIAKSIEVDSNGVIFGLNTFFALGMQSALTVTVAGSKGLALPIKDQYLIYGSLYAGSGLGFGAYFVWRKWIRPPKPQSLPELIQNE